MSHDTASGPPERDRTPPLTLVGILLVGALVVWVFGTVRGGELARAAPQVLGVGHAFESNSVLSASELDPVLKAAGDRLERDYANRNWWARVGFAATWASFALSAAITLMAGWFGVLVEPVAGSPDLSRHVRRRNHHLARAVGIIAALASVLTAAGVQIKAAADRHEAHASALHAAAKDARRVALARASQDATALQEQKASALELLDDVKRLTQ